jgi:ABC-type sugar transport system ATPase subunit
MSTAIVEFKNVTKRFPGVQALRGISLAVRRGSCHALCGENGAGKSTLGKLLAGIHAPDEGEVRVEDKPVRFDSPGDAMAAGIGMVHQELAFCENLSVAENLCLSDLPRRGPFLSSRAMTQRAGEYLSAIQADIDPRRLIGELPVSRQQLVQIAGAVARGARILVFDEPTSSLSQVETEHLFGLIKRLQAQGVTSIYVSHRLEEIFRLCDTITILRDGQLVATKPVAEVTEAALVQLMIGRPLDAYFPKHLKAKPREEVLHVENLSSPSKFENISFTLRAGEVLGMAGLVGAGRTEIAQALFGLDPLATGRVFIDGKPVSIHRPIAAMEHGLGLVPEDRKRHGLVLMMSSRENISLPTLERLARLGWINVKAERGLAKKFFDLLRIRAPRTDTVAASLSGGNQQKLVIAKWLAARCRILMVDEPTRGVDVGAKAEIHELIDHLAAEGSGVLLISSELPEVINLSTRILVVRAGKIVAEVPRDQATQENLMKLMAGIG